MTVIALLQLDPTVGDISGNVAIVEAAAAMAADSERAAASGLPSAAAAVPSGLGLGAGRLGADGAGDRADATPPEELQELQPAPVEEDEEVQRATAAGLQAAVVVTPLDNEEL